MARLHQTDRGYLSHLGSQARWASAARHGSEAEPGAYRRWRLDGVPIKWLLEHGYTPEPVRVHPQPDPNHTT